MGRGSWAGAFSGTSIYAGGQAGFAFGYKYLFCAVELTLAELFLRGELDAFGKHALDVNLDSFVVYPSVGLMGEF